MAEAVTIIADAKEVLLGVLGVVVIAKEILDNVHKVVEAAKEVVTAIGELVVAVRDLFQGAQWASWTKYLRSAIQYVDQSIPFDVYWRLGIARQTELIQNTLESTMMSLQGRQMVIYPL